MVTLSQGNQELLMVKTKKEDPPGATGVSNSVECDIFLPSVLRKGVGSGKSCVLVCWW